MLHWALFFFISSIVAAFAGRQDLATLLGNISMYLAVVFVGLFVFSMVMSRLFRSSRGR